MLSFPAGFKIFLALEPTDMRKQFNGLWAAASEQLREDPRQGAVFVFANRDRDRIKLLYWDGTGVWVLAKRLDRARQREDGAARSVAEGATGGCLRSGRTGAQKGRFSWPRATGPKLALAPAELTLLLAGIDLDKTSKKSWYNIK